MGEAPAVLPKASEELRPAKLNPKLMEWALPACAGLKVISKTMVCHVSRMEVMKARWSPCACARVSWICGTHPPAHTGCV